MPQVNIVCRSMTLSKHLCKSNPISCSKHGNKQCLVSVWRSSHRVSLEAVTKSKASHVLLQCKFMSFSSQFNVIVTLFDELAMLSDFMRKKIAVAKTRKFSAFWTQSILLATMRAYLSSTMQCTWMWTYTTELHLRWTRKHEIKYVYYFYYLLSYDSLVWIGHFTFALLF